MALSKTGVNRVRRAAARLVLPDPFDLNELCRNVEAHHGRRIVLAALPISTAGPCGLWLATDQTDFICFEKNTSALHQQHIVLHELGHILLEHADPESVPQALEALVPLLSQDTLRMMLARQHNGIQPADELEAELFAYTILSRAYGRKPACPELGDLQRRLLDALEG